MTDANDTEFAHIDRILFRQSSPQAHIIQNAARASNRIASQPLSVRARSNANPPAARAKTMFGKQIKMNILSAGRAKSPFGMQTQTQTRSVDKAEKRCQKR